MWDDDRPGMGRAWLGLETMLIPNYIRAHGRSHHHRHELLASERCGCFHCGQVFSPSEIVRWKDGVKGIGQTALCPKCGLDSVIGDKSGYPLTTRFLTKMKKYWF